MATYTTDLGKILNKLTVDEPLSSTQSFYDEEEVLLWTNPSPSSTFAPQTISIDLDGYKRIRIRVKTDDGNHREDRFISVGDIAMFHTSANVETSGSTMAQIARSFTVDDSGVTLGDAVLHWYNGTTTTVANIWLVPLSIYGIKNIGGGA